MAERHESSEADTDRSGQKPVRGSRTGTPRWVKAFLIAAIVLVVVFAAVHLAGGGMGSHTP